MDTRPFFCIPALSVLCALKTTGDEATREATSLKIVDLIADLAHIVCHDFEESILECPVLAKCLGPLLNERRLFG